MTQLCMMKEKAKLEEEVCGGMMTSKSILSVSIRVELARGCHTNIMAAQGHKYLC